MKATPELQAFLVLVGVAFVFSGALWIYMRIVDSPRLDRRKNFRWATTKQQRDAWRFIYALLGCFFLLIGGMILIAFVSSRMR